MTFQHGLCVNNSVRKMHFLNTNDLMHHIKITNKQNRSVKFTFWWLLLLSCWGKKQYNIQKWNTQKKFCAHLQFKIKWSYLFYIKHKSSCIHLLFHNGCHFHHSLHTKTEHRNWPACHSTSGCYNFGRCLGPSWGYNGDQQGGPLKEKLCVRSTFSKDVTTLQWLCFNLASK